MYITLVRNLVIGHGKYERGKTIFIKNYHVSVIVADCISQISYNNISYPMYSSDNGTLAFFPLIHNLASKWVVTRAEKSYVTS